MIAIIDYSTGNICSLANALQRLGTEFTVTDDPQTIRNASHVILPGVGQAAAAMQSLSERGLETLIPTLTQPLLGICIGMQLMCRSSQEGATECLGLFDADVKLLQGDSIKIPQMGWNTISGLKSPLFDGIPEGSFVYYVHSYAATIALDQTIATTDYGAEFSAALSYGNLYGCQFHPEKSGEIGSTILANFLKI